MALVKNPGEIWRCDVCGNVVEVIESGGGQLICCGGPMRLIDQSEKKPPKTAKKAK